MGLVEEIPDTVVVENDDKYEAADANFVIDRELNPYISDPNPNTNFLVDVVLVSFQGFNLGRDYCSLGVITR